MNRRRDGWRAWTARLAALLVAVQALGLAFVAGANAEPAPRDRFGNVLCSTDAAGRHAAGPAPSSGERHAAGLDCCTAGCPMFGGPVPAPAGPPLRAVQAIAPSVAFALRENAAAAGVPRSPRSAQGPPLSA